MRVPFLIRWPGHVVAGVRVPQIAGAIDLLPTLADLAGIERVGSKPLDGRSLKPLLLGAADDWADRMIFSHQNGRVSVRTQQYRLDDKGRLYDMTADPCQDNDIARREPEAAARLSKAVAEFARKVLSKSPDDRPFTVGYRGFPTTPLPARDGVPHGKVRRSAPAPNCSYFTNWRTLDDAITWDIEVASAGRYEAVVYYTCPQRDVGSTVELSFRGAAVRGRVTESNDPPPVGKEFDRVVRSSESYVKDFRPLKLGELAMAKGRGLLTLQAFDIPGSQVMDVRAVMLKLLD